MSKNSFLEKMEVKSPCSEDWNEMTGSDTVRFCSHCSKSVNNLSAMTRQQALKVVRRAKGEICVRYIKNPANNRPIFADKFYQITRRAGVVAGVLGASLSLSTLTYAQSSIPIVKIETTEISQPEASDKKRTESGSASISGTITDPAGAVIPNVLISLVNKTNSEKHVVSSNNEGFYEFTNLPAETFVLNVEAPGFQVYLIDDLTISEAENIKRDIQLQVGGIMGDIVVIAYENPLHRAVVNNDFKEAKSLLAQGEDVNSKDKNYGGITALFLAVENGNLEMTQLLLNFGAKINARNAAGQTPLMFLDEDATPGMVRLLIRYGAKLNLTDTEGNTALIQASRLAKPEVLQVLLTHGANIDAQNKEGLTALMNAADEGNLENVKALIQTGANVNLKNKDNETALDLATGEEEIEKLLESYGAIVKSDN